MASDRLPPAKLEETEGCGLLVFMQRPSIDESHVVTFPMLAMNRELLQKLLAMKGVSNGQTEVAWPLTLGAVMELMGKITYLAPTEDFDRRVSDVQSLIREAMGLPEASE